MRQKLTLASASPRRRELLTLARIPFEVQLVDVIEQWMPGETGREYVQRLAREKARAARGDLVLGADTTVELDGQLLEKPASLEEARRMLQHLSGRWHEVHTGICLRHGAFEVVDAATTRVKFVDLSEADCRWYAATGEPMGKAGAYAIQGLAARFVERIEGCYFNVVGLPVSLLWKHLRPLLAEPGDE